MKQRILGYLSTPFIFLFALYVFAWEWFWPKAKRFAVAIAHLRPVARLEGWIKSLSGWGALISFFSGSLLVFPFKALAFLIMAQGGLFFWLLGIAVFFFAKVLGGAYTAWIFKLVLPTLMQYRWFAKSYDWVMRVAKRMHAWADAQPFYQRMMEFKQRFGCVAALTYEQLREILFRKAQTQG